MMRIVQFGTVVSAVGREAHVSQLRGFNPELPVPGN